MRSDAVRDTRVEPPGARFCFLRVGSTGKPRQLLACESSSASFPDFVSESFYVSHVGSRRGDGREFSDRVFTGRATSAERHHGTAKSGGISRFHRRSQRVAESQALGLE